MYERVDTERCTVGLGNSPRRKERKKKAVMSTYVLCYYNPQEEVTLPCDASQFGLGAAHLQNGQPVAYASCILTDTETCYAQIKKELLAIVFSCEHFEPYVYGRNLIQVESDQKPLEAIFCKPIKGVSF